MNRGIADDKNKVALAGRFRAETMLSSAWIAKRLRMGGWSYVSNLLRTMRSAKSEEIMKRIQDYQTRSQRLFPPQAIKISLSQHLPHACSSAALQPQVAEDGDAVLGQ